MRIALEAETLVSALFIEGTSREDVVQSIHDRAGLSFDVRAKALSLAQMWPDSPMAMNSRSWSVAKESGRSDRDYARALRQAQGAVNAQPGNPAFLNTLGAALYRSRRLSEAVGRFEEGIKLRSGSGDAFDWVFLAMAHHRLGHRDEALPWLDLIRDKLHPDSDDFRARPEIPRLWAEAEAVVIYDPVFPADPFGH